MKRQRTSYLNYGKLSQFELWDVLDRLESKKNDAAFKIGLIERILEDRKFEYINLYQ